MRTFCVCIIGAIVSMCAVQDARAEKFAVFVSPTNTHGITVLTENEESGAAYCRITVPKDVKFLKATPDAHLVAKGEYSCNLPLKVVVERNGDRTITFRVGPKLLQTCTLYMSSGELASATYVLSLKDFKTKKKEK